MMMAGVVNGRFVLDVGNGLWTVMGCGIISSETA